MNVFDFRTKKPHDGNLPEVKFELARSAGTLDAIDAAFELQLRSALMVALPETLLERVLLAQTTLLQSSPAGVRQPRRMLWALAASVSFIALAATLWWQTQAPNSALLNQAIAHATDYEPQAIWSKGRIPAGSVRAVFAEFGLPMTGSVGAVSYINRCPIGNYRSIHMVLPTDSGPVTALYVAQAPVRERLAFERAASAGSISEFGRGALVLVGKPGQDFAQLEQRLKHAFALENVTANAAAYAADRYVH